MRGHASPGLKLSETEAKSVGRARYGGVTFLAPARGQEEQSAIDVQAA